MKKEAFAVCAAVFLLVFGANIMGTVLVPYTFTLGGTGLTVGIVYSCMYAVRLIFCAPIGRLSQRIGAKRVLAYSLTLYPVIAVAYLVSWNFPSLLFTRVLHGLASAMLLPMAMAYIGEMSPRGSEARYMAVYNAIAFTASALGPFLGGVIYDAFGVRWAFAAQLALALLAFAMMVCMAGGWKENKPAEARPEPEPVRPAARTIYRDKRLLALGSLNISAAMMLSLIGASFTQLALSREMSMELIGILIAAFNCIVGFMQFPFGRIADRGNRAALTLASGVAAAVLFICLPLAGKSVWVIALFVAAIGVAASLNLCASTALSAVLGRELGMSNTMGFLATASSAGTIAAYLSLGAVTDWLGMNVTFYFAAGVFLAGIAAFYFLWNNGIRPGVPERGMVT